MAVGTKIRATSLFTLLQGVTMLPKSTQILNHYPHFMYSVFLETKGLWDLQTVELLQILLTALSQHCVLTVRHCQFTFHIKVTSCCSSQIKRMLVDTFIPKPDLASTTNLFAANWAA